VKYMIMMFGGTGAAAQDRSPEWIARMHELMMKLDTELTPPPPASPTSAPRR
jgi:hypothetical protein